MAHEPQAVGYFYHHGDRSPPIRCMDVLDSFPCLTCGAGTEGRNLKCLRDDVRQADHAAYTRWTEQSA